MKSGILNDPDKLSDGFFWEDRDVFLFFFFFNHVLYLLVAKIYAAFINVLVSQRIGIIFSK